MLRITLLWPGKTKETWLQDGISKYVTKLRHYYQLNIVETRVKVGRNRLGRPEESITQESEALARQLAKLPGGTRIVALDPGGKAMDSEGLARFLTKEADQGTRDLCFVVGGAFGLGKEILRAAHLRLSLSPMTFTHDMTRLILAEQLYRAATIIAGQPYHH